MTLTVPSERTPQPTPQAPPRRWVRLLAATALAVAVVVATATRWDEIVHGHPAYAILLAVVGAVAVVVALSRGRRPKRPLLRGLRVVALGLAWVLALAAVVYFRPIPPSDAARQALSGGTGVRVTEDATTLTLQPVGPAQPVGVAFLPVG